MRTAEGDIPTPAVGRLQQGDGQLISQWSAFLNEATDVLPTMLAAADRLDELPLMAAWAFVR